MAEERAIGETRHALDANVGKALPFATVASARTACLSCMRRRVIVMIRALVVGVDEEHRSRARPSGRVDDNGSRALYAIFTVFTAVFCTEIRVRLA